MEELQCIRKRKTELSYDEQCSMTHAYMVATFGDQTVSGIGEQHEAITNIKQQMKFRELCSLLEPGNGFLCKLFAARDKTFEEYVDLGHHKPAEQYALCKILHAFDFISPIDTSTVTMSAEKILVLKDTVLGYRRLTKTGRRGELVADPIKAAVGIVGQQWFVKPKQLNKKGPEAQQYTLDQCGHGRYWGTPSWGQFQKYRDFETQLNNPHVTLPTERHVQLNQALSITKTLKRSCPISESEKRGSNSTKKLKSGAVGVQKLSIQTKLR